jgi:hypothetical protein
VYEFDRSEPYQQFRDVMDSVGELPCGNFPDAFFHDEDRPTGNRYTYTMAKELCSGCPIRVECLDYALAANEDHGVWGGLSPVERRQLKRNKKKGW